jgi:hypothetical protein
MCACFIFMIGCSAGKNQEGYGMENYIRALEITDPQTTETIQPDSETEKHAIERFKSFYAVFSSDIIKKDVRNVYAETAYFRDGYREVQGRDAIEAYFLKSAETVHECTFDIQDVSVHNGNYYFRWIMHLTTKRWKDEPITAVGMSHVRYDRDGMVTFHQDYWDTSVIYEKVPIMGSVIRWIKQQF